MNNRILSNEDIRRKAPSVFATAPWHAVSSKYAFIPTSNIVDALRNEGFMPVQAAQSRTRIAGKGEFTKHMLRFRRENDVRNIVGDEIPELVLVNSHDRSSSYQLSAGIFRLICSNGMTVKSHDMGDICVYHSGNIRDQVIEGSYRIIEEMPRVLEQIDALKSIQLDRPSTMAYAKAALELRWPSDEAGNSTAPITPEAIVLPRRSADTTNDLWTTFNRVQENFIKGGLRGTGSTGKRLKTRAINSVNEDLRMNKALWLLTEEMAKLLK